jgi:hypothetical protein
MTVSRLLQVGTWRGMVTLRRQGFAALDTTAAAVRYLLLQVTVAAKVVPVAQVIIALLALQTRWCALAVFFARL